MNRSEWDALCGLKEGNNCCSLNLPVYPENVRPMNRREFWVKLVGVIIILGVAIWNY